ncbi:helix-turn-helix domain-containing protein [Pseudomonas monteilii]|nr:helix-turn-helix domain-containing protein [Pseudomonas monteilii]
MKTSHTWPETSNAVKELMQEGATLAQTLPPEWLKRLDAAIASSKVFHEAPVLLAASRRAYRAGLLHWANANLRNPCAPVEPFISEDMLETTLELTRQGRAELLMDSARTIQNTCWEIWMKVAFGLTQDPGLLEELLCVSSRSITAFFDRNMRELTRIIEDEKTLIEQHNHVDKRYLVSKLLDGRETDVTRAKHQLNYDMGQTHQAGVIWSLAPDTQLRHLEEMAAALSRHTLSHTPLVVLAGPATIWVWLSVSEPLAQPFLMELAHRFPDERVALGSIGKGLNGFRRSHLEALTTQRMMSSLAGAAPIVSIDQVRMLSLMSQDTRAARRFVIATLGRLAAESITLQRSLYAFLVEGCNLTKAAETLGTHRNTLLRRVERAESLLPLKLADHRIQIGAALQLLLWSKPVEDDERWTS